MPNILMRVSLLIFFALGLSFCTESPKNDGDSKAAPPQVDAPQVFDRDGTPAKSTDASSVGAVQSPTELLKSNPALFDPPGDAAGVTSAEVEALKEKNLREPIMYGVGAGGITMDTTFEESKTLLTPPFRGPFADGLAFYNEQLVVIWKNEGSRKPQLIIPLKSYLGEMDAGTMGSINFQTKFLQYKGSDPKAGAESLIRDLYNAFEKVPADSDYDCLATGRCRLIYGTENQANMVLVLPGAVFLLAKEEFQVAEIRIIRDIDAGILANNIDLLSGDILVPNSDPINLGQSLKQINDQMEAAGVSSSPDVFIRTDRMIYAWNGVYLGFVRSNFDNAVEKAEEQDRTNFIEFGSEFPAAFTLKGLPIVVEQKRGEVKISARTNQPQPEQPEAEDQADPVLKTGLTMSTPVPQVNGEQFATKLTEFLKTQLDGVYDTVLARSFGAQNANKKFKEHFSNIVAYNNTDLSGVRVYFQVNEEAERMDVFGIQKITKQDNPFAQLVMPQMEGVLGQQTAMTKLPKAANQFFEPDQWVFNKLGGIELNEAIKLTDIDNLGRLEATVSFVDEKGRNFGDITERAPYVEQAVFEEPVDNRPKAREQGLVRVGLNDNVALGVTVVGKDDAATYARVVSITTSAVYGAIQDLCGLGADLQLEIGMSEENVLGKLNKAINKKKTQDKAFECNHFKVRDQGELGRVKDIYFPNERIVLGLADKALQSVTIYLPLNEVNAAMPEVKND